MSFATLGIPRFRVVHLQVWTLGCALGFVAYQAIAPPLNPRNSYLVLAYNLVMGMSLGTILSGAAILSARRWRGDRQTPSLPGHWLLLFGLAAALADGVAIVVYRLIKYPFENPPTAYWIPFHLALHPNLTGVYQQAVGWGLGAVASLAFCWLLRRRVPRLWLAVFLGFFLMAAVLAGGHIFAIIQAHRAASLSVIGPWCRVSVHLYAQSIGLCAFVVLVAVIWGMRRRSPTDGLHWLGITTWLAIASVQTIIYNCLF